MKILLVVFIREIKFDLTLKNSNILYIGIKAMISKDVQQSWRIQCNAGGGDYLDYVTIGSGSMFNRIVQR